MQRLYTVPELAQYFQVKPSTVYAKVRQNEIPHIRVGRLIRFIPEQIEDFVARRGHEGYSHGEPRPNEGGQTCV